LANCKRLAQGIDGHGSALGGLLVDPAVPVGRRGRAPPGATFAGERTMRCPLRLAAGLLASSSSLVEEHRRNCERSGGARPRLRSPVLQRTRGAPGAGLKREERRGSEADAPRVSYKTIPERGGEGAWPLVDGTPIGRV